MTKTQEYPQHNQYQSRSELQLDKQADRLQKTALVWLIAILAMYFFTILNERGDRITKIINQIFT